MELADILSEESVLVCTDISSKHDVLLRLAEQVGRQTGHPAAEIFEALNDRESLGSIDLLVGASKLASPGLGESIAPGLGDFSGTAKRGAADFPS